MIRSLIKTSVLLSCEKKVNAFSRFLKSCRFFSATERSILDTRNVGIIAHIDAGKTTTTEQMLFLCGETNAVGKVDNGDTVMDFLPEERERGITISAAAISFQWKHISVNLIDTPGHVDFTIEVERSSRVLDGSVIIIDAVSGVQAQTNTVWRQTKKQNIPALCFVNKMDRAGADFRRSIESVRSKLGAHAVPIQFPLGEDDLFKGVVDLIGMKKVLWNQNSEFALLVDLDSQDPLFEEALTRRTEMIEAIAEVDEPLMEIYLQQTSSDSATASDISISEVLSAIRRACCAGQLLPVLCGASLKGKGIEPLLDCIAALLPSPFDRPDIRLVHSENKESIKFLSPRSGELCCMCFKVVYDSKRGPLVYVRVFSGTLNAKQLVLNSTKNHKERINQLLKVSADDLDMISEAGPGSVCCIVGLKHTVTGDTLMDTDSQLSKYVLDGLTIPPPVYALSIEPEKSSQQKGLEQALNILSIEDPSLQVEISAESGQTLLRGIGELHLEIVCEKLRRQHGIVVTCGRAYVAFRESLNRDHLPAEMWHTYDRVIAQKKMYAAINFRVTATEKDCSDPEFVISPEVKQALTLDQFSALYDAIGSAISRGPLGFPIVGISVHVLEVKKDADTTPGAIRACVCTFIDSLFRRDSGNECRSIILEPIMSVEIELPDHYVGDILNDLTSQRRANIHAVNTRSMWSTINADVPLYTLLGYASNLRSMTQGEGSFSMEYLAHHPVDDSTALNLT